MEIKIKYKDSAKKIEQLEQGDWIDLCVAENRYLWKGDYAELDLGVAIELPKGYEALMVPRSSTFKKYGILMTNSVGVIDESYSGDNDWWRFPVLATREVNIVKGTRLCQFRIIEHQPGVSFKEVTKLGNIDRGGIGSTGE